MVPSRRLRAAAALNYRELGSTVWHVFPTGFSSTGAAALDYPPSPHRCAKTAVGGGRGRRATATLEMRAQGVQMGDEDGRPCHRVGRWQPRPSRGCGRSIRGRRRLNCHCFNHRRLDGRGGHRRPPPALPEANARHRSRQISCPGGTVATTAKLLRRHRSPLVVCDQHSWSRVILDTHVLALKL